MTAPVLDGSANPGFPAIAAGTANPAGITIAELVIDGSITDADGVAPEAIAITALDTSLGAWQFSFDDGESWLTVDAERINSTVNELALLLGPAARLRLLPFAGLHGQLDDAITFRAWDGTGWDEGHYKVIPPANGEPDPEGAPDKFSASSDTASITVRANDDLPDPPTTNVGTIVTAISAGSYDFATSVTTQADGKFVVAGVSQSAGGVYGMGIARYNIDGSLDTTFNATGLLTPHFGGNDWAWEVLVQADGRLLVAGVSGASTVIARYDSDGSPDTSFNGTGYLFVGGANFGNNLALQPDGGMVVAGFVYKTTFDLAVARVTAQGAADTTFGTHGAVTTDPGGSPIHLSDQVPIHHPSLAALGGGYANYAGATMTLSRSDGAVADDVFSALGDLRFTAGKAVFAGVDVGTVTNQGGTLRIAFNGNATQERVNGVLSNIGYANASGQAQPDVVIDYGFSSGLPGVAAAGIPVVGSVTVQIGEGAPTRSNTAPTFNYGTGKLVTGVAGNGFAVTVQDDGKLVVAGAFYNQPLGSNAGVMRFNADGTPDLSFNGSGSQTFRYGSPGNESAYEVQVQPDGKILVAGPAWSETGIARLNADGSLDTTWDGDGTLFQSRSFGSGMALQDDGSVLVSGIRYSYDSNWSFGVTRYLSSGWMDASFGSGGLAIVDLSPAQGDRCEGVIALPGGKVLAFGQTTFTGSPVVTLVRFNADGSIDTGFNGNGVVATSLGTSEGNSLNHRVAVQADGKIVVAGQKGADFGVSRYNADGTLDTAFGTGGTVTTALGTNRIDQVSSVAIQSDGRIIVAGSSAGTTNWDLAVARYMADGSLDTSFNGTGYVLTDVNASSLDVVRDVFVQDDGRIIVVGDSIADGAYRIAVFRYTAFGSLDTQFNPIGSSVGNTVSYVENAAPVALDDFVRVNDAELTALNGGAGNYAGASVTVARAGGANGQDVFSARGGLTFTAGNVIVSGTAVGTVSQAGGELRIEFNGNATQARVDTVLSSLGYANSSDAPSASVTLAFTFNDGNDGSQGTGGALTATGQMTVIVTPVNDAPTGTLAVSGKAQLGQLLTAQNLLADGDGMGAVSYQWLANGVAIAGANERSLWLDGALLGKSIAVRVSWVDGMGKTEAVQSASTAAITVSLTGTAGDDWLMGGSASERLTGLAGNDTLDGGAGNDTMAGGAGNDLYIVGQSRDSITEGANEGVDTVRASITHVLGTNLEHLVLTGSLAINGTGNASANTITGNAGANVLDGKGGIDRLDGGEGSDAYLVSLAADHAAAEFADSGTTGTDEVRFAATSTSTLRLFAGDTGIERVVITSSSSRNALGVDASAMENALSITGNAAANSLVGTAFADTLAGGGGNDVLTGGPGSDMFLFASAAGSSNKDTLTDFSSGVDTLLFSRAVFKGFSAAGAITESQFWSGAGVTSAHDADDRIIYNTTTGVLYYDADGTGRASPVQVAVVGTSTHPALVFNDVQVVA